MHGATGDGHHGGSEDLQDRCTLRDYSYDYPEVAQLSPCNIFIICINTVHQPLMTCKTPVMLLPILMKYVQGTVEKKKAWH